MRAAPPGAAAFGEMDNFPGSRTLPRTVGHAIFWPIKLNRPVWRVVRLQTRKEGNCPHPLRASGETPGV
jgi:hypothetical protein